MRRLWLVSISALAFTTVVAPIDAAAAPAAVPHARQVNVWPAEGQAAYAFGGRRMHISPRHRAAPIASMAKVMTAYVVLRRRPVVGDHAGFRMQVHARDVRDWQRRVGRGESTVAVRLGEVLTERQALAALLLPSANNIAIMLARRVAGTVRRFVGWMNRTAVAIRMRHSVYIDPSGFDPATRSTPADQLRLATTAMTIRFLRSAVRQRQARIPVAGTVRNTDTLLGRDGFAGIKTGSMSASGGCFMFRSRRLVHGRTVVLTGVVMGQSRGELVAAALNAARRLVDQVAPRAATRRA